MIKIKKRSTSDRIFRTIGFILMFLFSFIFIFSILWMFMSSFRSAHDFRINSFNMFDFKNFTLSNYQKAFTYKVDTANGSVNMLEMIENTLITTLGCLVLSVTIPNITGYVVAKYNFTVKKIMDFLAVVTMIIPTIGSTVVLYRFINNLGIMDTYLAIWIQYAGGFGFTYMIFRGFYSAIPIDYAEAAFIDGATDMQVFTRTMLPQALPITISVTIVQFIGIWNDYYTPYMFMENKPTVAVGVNFIYTKFVTSGQNFPVAFAAMSFATIVSLILYACFSKTIMESMSVGGLKG